MRKRVLVPVIGLLVVGLSSTFRLVSAADPAETGHRSHDVALAKDADLLSENVPPRTTIAHLFENHMIQGADSPAIVSSSRRRWTCANCAPGSPTRSIACSTAACGDLSTRSTDSACPLSVPPSMERRDSSHRRAHSETDHGGHDPKEISIAKPIR
jgi:hypothetical protein